MSTEMVVPESNLDRGKDRLATESSALLPPVAQEKADDDDDENFWTNPWLLSVSTTLLSLLPSLILATVFAHQVSGRTWPATMFAVQLSVALLSAYLQLSAAVSNGPISRFSRCVTSMASLLDICLCHKTYPSIAGSFDFMFRDIDGTPVDEWKSTALLLQLALVGFWLVVLSRTLVGGLTLLEISCRSSSKWNQLLKWLHIDSFVHGIIRRQLARFASYMNEQLVAPRRRFKSNLHGLSGALALLSVAWLAFCIQSCVAHLTDWKGVRIGSSKTKPSHVSSTACCDDMDPTECSLPFPSFHHMVADKTTKTGWRVALHSDSLPFLRGGVPLDPGFWNELDGFSTMAPILFYGLQGLKESHMASRHGTKAHVYPHLIDDNVQESITPRSITFLWDVNRSELIPHTAQFDDLDPHRPLIMMVPAQPLRHGTHYAVAVINATDILGQIIPPTFGVQSLLTHEGGAGTLGCVRDDGRRLRYHNVLLPSLQVAAPWLAYHSTVISDGSLQLMFDFVTMSRDSLETIERVRDATLEAVAALDKHDVSVVRIEDHDCSDNATNIARTIHGNIRVPWFLESPSRGAVLSKSRLPINGTRLPWGAAKFVVRVPCCLMVAALGENSTGRAGRPLRAVIEYGHGLFYNRAEAYDQALLRVAEDHGYLIMAMDWRGMSSFDLPVVIRTLLGQPKLFQATRDNLYQGYANKIVLQHYAKTEMLNATWLQFSRTPRRRNTSPMYRIPLADELERPTSVFYGSSQGGILGAGYTTLLGETGLIDRGVLGVPGTSFSLVLSRSAEFATYDSLLLRNFYRNRQVRIIMSIIQLGWDPVEAAGQLAPPVKPGSYPPMLLQSGLGDAIVPTIATEALARAYNASILPNNPRTEIFGISVLSDPVNQTTDHSHVVWTEVLYEKEYQKLPLDNTFPAHPENHVHPCLRQDCALMAQFAAFVNTGEIIDPCINDSCQRRNVSCNMPWMGIQTRPRNWTCSECSSSSEDSNSTANANATCGNG